MDTGEASSQGRNRIRFRNIRRRPAIPILPSTLEEMDSDESDESSKLSSSSSSDSEDWATRTTDKVKANGGRTMTRVSNPLPLIIEKASSLDQSFNTCGQQTPKPNVKFTTSDLNLPFTPIEKTEVQKPQNVRKQFDEEYKCPLRRTKVFKLPEITIKLKGDENETNVVENGNENIDAAGVGDIPTKTIVHLDNKQEDDDAPPIHKTLSCLKISKVDCSAFYADIRRKSKLKSSKCPPECEFPPELVENYQFQDPSKKDPNNNDENPSDNVCAQLDRKWSQIQRRIREWMMTKPQSCDNNIMQVASLEFHPNDNGENFKLFKPSEKLQKGISENLAKVDPVRSKVTRSQIYHAEDEENPTSKESFREGRSGKTGASRASQKDLNTVSAPQIPSLLLDQFHATVKSMCPIKSTTTKEGSKQKALTKKKIESDLNQLPPNFQDVSFHYQSEEGDLQKLTPTGFSINFKFPKSLGTNYSQETVSTYFPGKSPANRSKSYCTTENMKSIPIPKYITELEGKTKKSSSTKSNLKKPNKVPEENVFLVDSVKPSSPRDSHGFESSNFSMIPMVYSTATCGSLSQSQQKLSETGCSSENGCNIKSHHNGRRRPGCGSIMKKRRGSGEVSGIGWKIRDILDKQNVAALYQPISGTSLSSSRSRPQVVSKSKLVKNPGTKNPPVIQDHWSTLSGGNFSENFLSSNKINNNNTNPTKSILRESSSERETTPARTGTKSVHFLNQEQDEDDEENEVWKSWKKAALQKPYYKKISRATQVKYFSRQRTIFHRLYSDSSSQKSLSARSSNSKNFVRENIEKAKAILQKGSPIISSRMQKEDRPPLPTSGNSSSRVSTSELSSDNPPTATEQVIPPSHTPSHTPPSHTPPSHTPPSHTPPSHTPSQQEEPGSSNYFSAELAKAVEIDQKSKAKPKPKSTSSIKVNNKPKTVKKSDVLLKEKLIEDSLVPGPYYNLASASERELIDELVKADMDAILDRDANGGKYTREIMDLNSKISTPRMDTAGSIVKPHGTHWAHKNKNNKNKSPAAHHTNSTPLPRRRPHPADMAFLSDSAPIEKTWGQRSVAPLYRPPAGGTRTGGTRSRPNNQKKNTTTRQPGPASKAPNKIKK